MVIQLTPFVRNYFSNPDEQKQLFDFIQIKLPIYVTSHSSKIKPVRQSTALYELKIRVGRDFYRLAYTYQKETIVACYLTKTLQKVRFDKEVNKYLKEQP